MSLHASRRRFLGVSLGSLSLAFAAALTGCSTEAWLAHRRRRRSGPLRIAVMGLRSRGLDHIRAFSALPDARVVALCDCDEDMFAPALKLAPGARTVRDLRELLADEEIDALSIAAPNHWHALAALWAMAAGKDVYVEKPISWSFHEGELVAEAARRTGAVVQHGTQARSHRACREGIAWMQACLGPVRHASMLCFKPRAPVVLTSDETPPPPHCDISLWSGPAPVEALHRKSLHYDWHWRWNTGNGDLGNQGVHQVDLARWGLRLDTLPTEVVAAGARIGPADAGETPNTELAALRWPDGRLITCEVRGLATEPFMGCGIGVIFHGACGTLTIDSDYSKAVARDLCGNVVRKFEGGGDHFADFVRAVREGRDGTATAADGHMSSALIHLAQAAWRAADTRPLVELPKAFAWDDAAAAAALRMQHHLAGHGCAPDAPIAVSPVLRFDPAATRFVAAPAAEVLVHATRANAFLRRAVEREPFLTEPELRAKPAWPPLIGVCTSSAHAATAASAGASHIEISCSGELRPTTSSNEIEAALERLRALPVPVRAANGFLPADLKSVGPDAAHGAIMRYAESAVARAVLLGIEVITFGSAGSRQIPSGFSRADATGQFVGLLHRLGNLAARHGIIIAVEPLEAAECNFLNRLSEVHAVVAAAQHPHIAITADLYHMRKADEGPDAITCAGSLIRHVHVAERDRRTPPGTMGDDLRPWLRALHDIRFAGRMSIECGWSDFAGQLPGALKTLREQCGT